MCMFLRCFTAVTPDENWPDEIQEEMFLTEVLFLNRTHVMFVTFFLALWLEVPVRDEQEKQDVSLHTLDICDTLQLEFDKTYHERF